jgi:heparosan-N-sulfate-glucuronate 5-epimerase
MSENQSLKIKRQLLPLILASLVIAFLLPKSIEDTSLARSAYSETLNKQYSSSIQLDTSSIPLVNYSKIGGIYIGLQRNPLTVAHEAFYLFNIFKKNGDSSFKQLFLNNANWLVANAMPYGNYSILEYKFPWPPYDLKAPWRSGLAQGEALSAFIMAHEITGQTRYLDSAKMLLNSFFVDVKNGGVTYKSPQDGWWFAEYASTGGKDPKSITAMMQTMLGIYDYYNKTHDNNAKYLFDKGVLGLKKNLPHYGNTNGTLPENNDILGDGASLASHNAHVELLGHLYDITNEQVFKAYHDKWQNINSASMSAHIPTLKTNATSSETNNDTSTASPTGIPGLPGT